MFTISSLKIRGFRGYVEEREINFDNPVVLIYGHNHQGKSSTLNAIEWCFFGDKCRGKDTTGIRERVGWEIGNKKVKTKDVEVEMVLQGENPQEKYTLTRTLNTATRSELQLVTPDGEVLREKQAEDAVSRVFDTSFKDFMTTVYQHQEAIRAVLTQEPKDRNEALDRLFGLSDYRDIISAIESSAVRKKHGDMIVELEALNGRIETAINTRQVDLQRKTEDALKLGIEEKLINAPGAIGFAQQASTALASFCREAGLEYQELAIPDEWEELEEFNQDTRGLIARYRVEMPDVRKQTELHTRKGDIEALKQRFSRDRGNCDSAGAQLSSFIEENGDEESLKQRKEDKEKERGDLRDRLRKTKAKAAVVNEAMQYLKLHDVDKDVCPVCGNEYQDILSHLEDEWEKHYADMGEEISKQIETLNGEIEQVDGMNNKLRGLRQAVETASKDLTEALDDTCKIVEKELSLKDDIEVILDGEINRLEEELGNIGNAVGEKQQALNGIEEILNRMLTVREILVFKQSLEIVNNIKKTEDYEKIEDILDEMAVFNSDLAEIRRAVSEASQEEAESKIREAEGLIDDYFSRIAKNQHLGGIKIEVKAEKSTGKNSYEFTSKKGVGLAPILSQGDLNALALSIYLGMASSGEIDRKLDFIILDDPSQSLDIEHMQGLIEVLNEVLQRRMVILSTMHKELLDLAASNLTKAKTVYTIRDWSPEEGPVLTRE